MHSKSKVFEKNLLYQRILLDAFTVHERVLFLIHVKYNILLTHTYDKMLTSAKIFTEYKLKAFNKNLIHQKISHTTFFAEI